MKARTQRTHFMGFSNRNPSNNMRNTASGIYENSFIKSRSQYYQTTSKVNHTTANFASQTSQLPKSSTTAQFTINSVYKDAQKGHHHEFQSKRLTKKQKNIQKFYQNHITLAPLPLNMKTKLNAQVQEIKQEFKDKEINLHKLNELKHTFLRNNQKRRNLKNLFDKFANQNGVVDKNGFKRLIKQYGYDINDHEVNLMFKLNNIHEQDSNCERKVQQGLQLPQFVNLMTKENVYFKTLRLNDNTNRATNHSGYKFSAGDFEVFRNKFSKLKEAFNVYKGEKIDEEKFEKVMKKLDINDLVVKQERRRQIFEKFASQNDGCLNVQQLLGAIATQQHQRVNKSGNQFKLTNHDKFEDNIAANEQFKFEKDQTLDPLMELLYPIDLKKTSYVDYERNLQSAQQICSKLKEIKQFCNRDVIKQLCQSKQNVTKDELYKKVEKLLQSEGYNFNKNQYKSFMAYLDFDSANQISTHKLQNFILHESEKQRVHRLDRRVRNQQKQAPHNNEESSELRKNQDEFVDRFRSKSSVNWTAVKRSTVKQENIPEFKVPTKFSAWPERLYNADFSLVQAKSNYGMGINENQRFQKDEKHFIGQEDRLRKLKIYENKVRKIAEWSELNQRRVEERANVQQSKQSAKQYNLRLLKEQYEDRCHCNSAVR